MNELPVTVSEPPVLSMRGAGAGGCCVVVTATPSTTDVPLTVAVPRLSVP